MSGYIGNSIPSVVGIRNGNVLPVGGIFGELFYNSVSETVYIWNGNAWIAFLGNSVVPTGMILPVNGDAGQLFFSLADKKMYVFDGDGWVLV